MPKPSTMYFIIYSSKAIRDISQEELHDILEHSKKNNEANEITGLLIFFENTFIQMLEGEKEAVEETYEKICLDNRHETVLTLFSGDSDRRYFPNWKMALEVVDKNKFRQIDAYESLAEGDQFLNQLDDDHIGLRMLRFFYEQKKQ